MGMKLPLCPLTAVDEMHQDRADVRWKQRFSNYKRALKQLSNAIKIVSMSEIERAGLIQFFEMTFELAWKLMKDYLEEEGFVVSTPREAIKIGFQIGMIKNGDIWMEALAQRNLAAHTYDEKRAVEAEKKIRDDYFKVLQELYVFFQGKE